MGMRRSRPQARPATFMPAGGGGAAAVAAEGAARDLDAGWGLAALVLGPVHEADDAPDVVLVEAGGQDLGDALVLLYVGLEDGVEDLVGREGVGVALVLAQLGRGFLVQDGLGDRLPPLHPVDLARDPVDEVLRDVLYDGEASGRVAVEGRVADAHLALVARGQNDPAELVGERHQDVPPDAALQVLLGP